MWSETLPLSQPSFGIVLVTSHISTGPWSCMGVTAGPCQISQGWVWWWGQSHAGALVLLCYVYVHSQCNMVSRSWCLTRISHGHLELSPTSCPASNTPRLGILPGHLCLYHQWAEKLFKLCPMSWDTQNQGDLEGDRGSGGGTHISPVITIPPVGMPWGHQTHSVCHSWQEGQEACHPRQSREYR